MTSVGSPETRLIVLRGDSGSGKTTTARALRPHLRDRTAHISQDYLRRDLLSGGVKEKRSVDASFLLDSLARQALDMGYDVILDGILNLRDYAVLLERLWLDHLGTTRFYQFDVGLEETMRRHATRALRNDFGTEEMASWYDGWQPLNFLDENRVEADVTTAELVKKVLEDLAGSERK